MTPNPINTAPPPKVSIGMPVYNGAKYIAQALESLLSQTCTDFEIIISDNASTDSTQALCEDFSIRDPRVIYVRQERNLGPGENFAFVLQRARGIYFMWAAHDDIWASNWLDILLAELRPSDAGVRGAIRFMEGDRITVERQPKDYPQNGHLALFMGKETIQNARNLYVYSLFFREKLLAVESSILLRNGYSWDFIFAFQLTGQGALRSTAATFQIYRLHPESEGSQVMARHLSLRRLLYRVNPLSYYLDYYHASPPDKKLWILLLIAPKHLYNQTQLWWRGFRKIVLGRENI